MKKRDNDEIYNELKQVIKDDSSIELNADSDEFQLLGRIGALTFDRYIEQIREYMTPERAHYVRKLRIDDELSWRGVTEQWEKDFPNEVCWQPSGNQLAGMALCELAALYFGEDYMQPPWN